MINLDDKRRKILDDSKEKMTSPEINRHSVENKNRLNSSILRMDVEEQIRRIFDNEISYNIAYNSGIEDDISFIIEDDTFLIGDLRSTVSWSLVGQHVILYVEILNEKNRIDFNLILCPNHNLERDIITKMRNISSLNIEIMGKYRFTKVGEDITSDQNSAINHFVSKTLSFIGLNDAYNKNLQTDVIKKYCPTCK